MRLALVAPPWYPVPPPAYGGIEALPELLHAAYAAGRPIVVAAKCSEPAERRYFQQRVRLLLDPDDVWSAWPTPMRSVTCSAVPAAWCSRCGGRSRSGW